MKATIWHNPNCGTSRNTLAMLEQAGCEVEVLDYLTIPLTKEELAAKINATGLSVREVIREKGTPYEELGLADDGLSEDQLLEHMLTHRILINRPIVTTDLGTRLCRPSEKVLEILPEAAITSFTKEDGEVVK